MYAHIHTYRPILPSLWSRLAPVSIVTDGDGRRRDPKRGRHREEMAAIDTMSLYHVYISYSLHPHIFLHKSCIPAPCIYSYAIQPPIPPFSLEHPIYHHLPPSIYQDSSYCLRTPANSHSSTQSTYLSVCPSNQIPPCIMTFNIPINFWKMTFQSSIFSLPSIDLPTHPLLHVLSLSKDVFVDSSSWLFLMLHTHTHTHLPAACHRWRPRYTCHYSTPCCSLSLSSVVHVVKKHWVTPKSPAGPSKSKSPLEVRLAGWQPR